jgi:type II restriction enzyme
MNLSMPADLAQNYKSLAQQARVVSEGWGSDNLFCPNCPSPALNPAPNNTQAFDFVCPNCKYSFQLKSKSSPFGNRILDGAYEAMMRAIREDRTPNLFALQYNRNSWQVNNLILVPHFAFSSSSIEVRKPLSETARRAGWAGCFILLENIPSDAKIPLVSNGAAVSTNHVREKFSRLQSLEKIGVKERGWTLDVLRSVRALGKKEFTNNDIYSFEPQLKMLHPNNLNIQAKIRQQLQFLRDKGFLTQTSRGLWTVIDA